jgi:hypothetical protein
MEPKRMWTGALPRSQTRARSLLSRLDADWHADAGR